MAEGTQESPDSSARTRRLRQLLSVAILGVVLVVAWQMMDNRSGKTKEDAGAGDEARELFALASAAPGRTAFSRMRAAAQLARLKSGEPYAILILLVPDALEEPADPSAPAAERERRAAEASAVVAALIANVQPTASDALLEALTRRLSDSGIGQYEEKGKPATTEAVRDLARAALRRVLGSDHEYDAKAWLKEIHDATGRRMMKPAGK